MGFLDESRYSHSLTKLITYLKKFDIPELRRFVDLSLDTQSLAREPLKIVVAGEFNAGKSTFINALLKKEVMPTNVIRETVTINKLVYGSKYGIEIYFKDENQRPKSISCAPDTIVRHLKDAANQAYLIKYINVYFDLPELKNFTIIDTPGTNFSVEETNLSLDTIKEADILIWLTQKYTSSEYDIVNKLTQSKIPIVCLINYIDMISLSELKDLVEDITKRGGTIFKKYFPLSAKQAFEGYVSGDQNLIEKGRINDFLFWIQNEIFGQHYQLIFERIKDRTLHIFKELENFVNQEASDTENKIESVNLSFQDIAQKLQTDFYSLLETFMNSFQKYIDSPDLKIESETAKTALLRYVSAIDKNFKCPSDGIVFAAVKGEVSINTLLSEIERLEKEFLNHWESIMARYKVGYPDHNQFLDTLELNIGRVPPTYVYAMYVCGAMHFAGMNSYLFLKQQCKMLHQEDQVHKELVKSYSNLISETVKMFKAKTLNELKRKVDDVEEIRQFINALRQQDL